MNRNLRYCQHILITALLLLTCKPVLASLISEEKNTCSFRKKTTKAVERSISEDRMDQFFKTMINKENYVPPDCFEFDLTTSQTIYLLESIIKKMRQPSVEDKIYAHLEMTLKVWLNKFERQVFTNGSLSEAIFLLELYEHPETKGKRKQSTLIAAIEKKKNCYRLNEMLLLANYYYYAHLDDQAKKWHDRIVSQGFEVLTVSEKLTLAKSYFEGNGVISCDLRKSREIYLHTLMHSDRKTKNICIRSLEKINQRSSLTL